MGEEGDTGAGTQDGLLKPRRKDLLQDQWNKATAMFKEFGYQTSDVYVDKVETLSNEYEVDHYQTDCHRIGYRYVCRQTGEVVYDPDILEDHYKYLLFKQMKDGTKCVTIQYGNLCFCANFD